MQGIEMRGIQKYFGSKPALKQVDLTIRKGTIHAIIGENGAGKSTLVNILSGVLQPTRGEILVDGSVQNFQRPQDAAAAGIGMVHQHFMLVPSLSVWQNAILGAEPGKRGRIDKRAALDLLNQACTEYDMPLNLEQAVGTLTVGEQQRVEILKVLIRSAEYIIFDEPTAVLTPQEIHNLLENMRSLKAMGKTIIFISHKLEEVLAVADDISVLRLGEKVGTVSRAEVDTAALIQMMVGRAVRTEGMPLETEKGQEVLRTEGLCTGRTRYTSGLDHVSIHIRAGEVLGIAGVDGNGQNELIRALFGLERVTEGKVWKGGKELTNLSSAKIRRCGMALIPPDRQKHGLVMNSSITRNTVLGCESSRRLGHGVFLKKAKLNREVETLAKAYDVRMPSVEANVSELSGGNQQKVILAREFGLREADLIAAVNPTRGLDIGAIEFVYDQLEEQKKAGKAVLLVSTELSEVLRLSDRIAVFFKGKIMGIVDRKDADVDKLGMMMAGLKPEGVET